MIDLPSYGSRMRRLALMAALPLFAVWLLLSCGGDERTLTILYWQAPTLPGPYLSGGTKDRDAGAITLEPLAHYDPDGVLVPALAETIPTLDNGGVAADLRSITWSLQQDVKWSDGSDLTAADVVFTWRYCSDTETGCTAAEAFAGIRSVEALDEHTVRIHFESPTPYPYRVFVGGSQPIISRSQFEDCVGAAAVDCVDQNQSPLGTGPYRIVSFAADSEAIYERNPHYRGDRPYFDQVILRGGGSAEAAARAVLGRGEADYAWNLQIEPSLLAELEANGRGRVVSTFADLVERLVLNQANSDPSLGEDRSEYLDGTNPHPFLSFLPLRQAMSMAIDRGQIAELYGFAGRPECDLVAGPPHYTSGANNECLAQDVAGAQRLLDEHGIVDADGDGIREYQGVSLRVSFVTSTNAIRQATQALIRDWWREIGIATEVLDFDASVYFGGDPIEHADASYRRFFTDVQMFTTGGGIEPERHLADQRCNQIAVGETLWVGGNVARACNPEYDLAFAELPGLPLGAEREALVKQLNDLLVRSYVQIPLVSRGAVSAHLDSLKGVRFNAWDSELWNIAEWRR